MGPSVPSDVPTVFRFGPYRFFFYAADWAEPPHIHVRRDRTLAKFWLDPVRLANNDGFGAIELNRVTRLVQENVNRLLEAWDDFFKE